MDKINELLTRGVANIIPSKQELEKKLRSGKKLNIYLGIDPTSPHIHLGHAVSLRKLELFVELGHNVTLLIGDFTALVGDTSDKESERPILTEEEIEKNFLTYKAQAEKILDFTKIKIKHNKEWLEKLTYKELLRLKQQFSLNDFISRELIKKRLNEGKRVRLDEAEYPIMQGYDSYFLDTDIQIGGTDQTFNMQAGRILQKNFRNKDSFVLTTEFLMGTDGRKMSKSWGNAIWLDDSEQDMYAKVLAIKDDLIIQYFVLATNIPLAEIHKINESLDKGEHPMLFKKRLAFQIVSEIHSTSSAQKAQDNFEKTIQKKQTPQDIAIFNLIKPLSILEILVESKLSDSKSDARRLITQGAVSLDNEKITDPNQKIKSGILKVGPHRFLKIKIK